MDGRHESLCGLEHAQEPHRLCVERCAASARILAGGLGDHRVQVSANFALDIVSWRPGKRLSKVRAPILVCACEGDSVAPPEPTIAYTKCVPNCELKTYPYGHFDIYAGEPFERVTRDQLAFLEHVVPVRGVDVKVASASRAS